jgi:hypothetical protein
MKSKPNNIEGGSVTPYVGGKCKCGGSTTPYVGGKCGGDVTPYLGGKIKKGGFIQYAIPALMSIMPALLPPILKKLSGRGTKRVKGGKVEPIIFCGKQTGKKTKKSKNGEGVKESK